MRETLRRWWDLELGTAAGGGFRSGRKPFTVSRHNRICTACLDDEEGSRRCVESIRKAIAGTTGAPGLAGPCHLGLDIAVARLPAGGGLFTCGFFVESRVAEVRERALRSVAALRLPVVDSAEAFDGIARIDERDVPRLADLVATAAAEMAACAALEQNRPAPQQHGAGANPFPEIVGTSLPMRALYALLEKLVKSDITVLVTGENGTGKELIARALHRSGPRKDKPFVAQNCSALNDNLLESELFGHVKGSFTGATRDKIGLFKLADGGTLFLDEVGDMSPSMQVKLLRVLQEGTFLPVGAEKPEEVDVRIIAATNRDLREMVVRKEFREDLFYRLHVVNVEVPALRDRIEDLPLLCEHFLARIAARTGTPKKRLHPELLRSFYDAPWAGNVRELENELERLVVLAGEAVAIPPELRLQARPDRGAHAPRDCTAGSACDLATAVGRVERDLIERGLRELHGNKSRLAARLGVSRTTLIKKIREYRIEQDRAEGEEG